MDSWGNLRDRSLHAQGSKPHRARPAELLDTAIRGAPTRNSPTRGTIAFRDFAFARELLRIDAIRNVMLQGDVGTGSSLDEKQLSLFRNAAEALPHMLQTCVTNGAITTWSTVNDAFTTASTGDLILKCGGNIQGAWTITGVLDAKSNEGNIKSEPKDSGDVFSTEFRVFGNALRNVIGRPAHCYGVTPLTIHRKVEVPKCSSAT